MKLKLLDSHEFDKIHHALRFALNFYGLKFTDHQLKKSIQSHTDATSLLAVKDILADYGINSTVIRKDNYAYEDFETPFICLIKKETWADKNFTVVTQADDGQVEFLNVDNNQLETLPAASFEAIDEKYILLMDGSDKVDEPAYEKNKKQERKNRLYQLFPFALTFLLIICNLIFRNSELEENLWQKNLFLFTFYLGMLISAALIWQEVDSHNPFFRKLCGGEQAKKTDCDVVLTSEGAKFLGVSWSIWGLSYFFSLFMLHLLFFNPFTTLFSGIASLIGFWYIGYSIYYQYKVIKKWCRLCLMVQGILAVNFLLALFQTYNFTQNIDWALIGIMIGFGLLIVFLSSYLILNLKQAKRETLLDKKWRRLRFNETVFQSLLAAQPKAIPLPPDAGITIGEPDAPIEMIKVCNLYCGPCAMAHKEIAKLLSTNKRIKLRILFNPSGQQNDRNLVLALYFMGIEAKYGTHTFHQALEEWFGAETKNPKDITAKYPIEEQNLSIYLPKVKLMADWCHQMNVNRTPTFFINGYPLPDDYNFTDFKFLF